MKSAKAVVGTLIPPKLKVKLREQFVSMNVTHLYGPRTLHVSMNEAVVTCVLKNGEYYLEAFIQHYLRMGFRHIFFLDNGSTDQTLSIAKSYDNVSVCQSTLPIGTHQRLFKRYMAERSVKGGWCLDADIDEFFDYPYSDIVNLESFLSYLNSHKFTAVVTQLLDMFSDRPLSDLASEEKEDLKSAYQYFDISAVTRTDYRLSAIVAECGANNKVGRRALSLLWGGIRKTLYGNNCLLTKHSLFLPGAEIDLFPHVHFVNGANISDVSAVMLHYKLTNNAMAMALQNKDGFKENCRTYSAFIDVLKSQSSDGIKKDTAQRFVNPAELVRDEFLSMSDEYLSFAASSSVSTLPIASKLNRGTTWPKSRA
jgi:hypothetical protein